MSILSGFKKFIPYLKTDTGYQQISYWTKSDAVIMGDGTDNTNTLEKNLGNIKGITDSLTATSSNIALSAKAGNDLQTKIDKKADSTDVTDLLAQKANSTHSHTFNQIEGLSFELSGTTLTITKT